MLIDTHQNGMFWYYIIFYYMCGIIWCDGVIDVLLILFPNVFELFSSGHPWWDERASGQ